jgi:hypothetical protein
MIRRAETDADRELCAQISNTLNPARVMRSHRRRGIERFPKRSQIAWAAAEGYQRLVTETQTGNEGMRSLNLELGYRERLSCIDVERPLQ